MNEFVFDVTESSKRPSVLPVVSHHKMQHDHLYIGNEESDEYVVPRYNITIMSPVGILA